VFVFKNYLKIAARNILKHRGTSFINISGLAIGMACTILIFLWVQDEMSYDRFHVNTNEIHRIVQDPLRASDTHEAVTPGILGGVMEKEFPEVVKSARFSPLRLRFKYGNESFLEKGGVADPEFFEMFTFPFIKGDSQKAFSDPFSIVITEKVAKKYFASEDPIGKVLSTINKTDFKVTGVIKSVSHNSHLQFDYLIPFKLLKRFGTKIDNWSNVSFYTYVLLREGSSRQEVDQKLKKLIEERDPGHNMYYLQPLTRIHLYSNFNFDISSHGDIEFVTIFSLIAIFVLLIACINFMSLSTARSVRRAREIGIRKVVGATRLQLIIQFLGESILLAFIGGLLALVVVIFVLPFFNNLVEKPLSIDFSNLKSILGFAALVLFTGIVSGSYPAFFLSSYQPKKVLKTLMNKEANSRSPLLQKLLVVIQFALAIILISGTIVVYNQLGFIKNAKLGFDKNNLIHMPLRVNVPKYEVLKNRLFQNPGILGVTASDYLLTSVRSGTSSADWEGKAPNTQIQMNILSVDYDYLKTYKMEMREGRFFSKEFPSDPSGSIVINESAVKEMGIQSPVGKRITPGKTDYRIIGVIKNFHYKSVHRRIEPLIIKMFKPGVPGANGYLTVRIYPDNISEKINFLETIWKEYNPGYPFEYGFLDDTIYKLYKAEQQMGKIFIYFTLLAIFISCVGLIALSAFMAERKAKEIGIRKVFGASTSNITFLFLGEFAKWVFLANVIAWPVAHLFINKWLRNFAYRIDIKIWIFIFAGLSALVIAMITVGYQAVKTALANPIKALKYE